MQADNAEGTLRRQRREVRKLASDTDEYDDEDLKDTTPAQRIGMMWQLAQDAWAFTGKDIAQSHLSRHIVRVHRRVS